MTDLADVALIEQRLIGIGREIMTNIQYANVADPRQFYSAATGIWNIAPPARWDDEGALGAAALAATLWAVTKPRDQHLVDLVTNTMNRLIARQYPPTAPSSQAGFWDDGGPPAVDTKSTHAMHAFAAIYDIFKPYLPANVTAAWLASYKTLVDAVWRVDAVNGTGLFWVNGNYNLPFEALTRWYALRSGDPVYLARADLWWDFLMNGTTTNPVVSSIPYWPLSVPGGNGGQNPTFLNYGMKWDTVPTLNDWSDGKGWLVETDGTIPNPTNANSFDQGYTATQYEDAIAWWYVTGDPRYKRLALVLHNKMYPLLTTANLGTIMRKDGSVVAATNITSITGSNPVTVTTSTPHGLATGDDVVIKGVVGTTSVNMLGAGTGWIVTVLSATTYTIPVVSNGAYVSGGTSQAGSWIACWNFNGFGGSRKNVQFGFAWPGLAALTWFGPLNNASLLISQLSNYAPGSSGGGNDGKMEVTIRSDSLDGGTPGHYLRFFTCIAVYIGLCAMARHTYRHDRSGAP